MEDGDHHESNRERAPVTRNDAVDGASSDPAASRRGTNPAGFVSAGMWHGQGIAEQDRDQQVMTATRRRRAYAVVADTDVVTDPDAGMPPGYMKHSPGARIMAAMGYKVGMGIGKEPGISRPLRVRLQQPSPSSATENLSNP
ncbi:unnamed protein product [Alopecurus aequalis]